MSGSSRTMVSRCSAFTWHPRQLRRGSFASASTMDCVPRLRWNGLWQSIQVGRTVIQLDVIRVAMARAALRLAGRHGPIIRRPEIAVIAGGDVQRRHSRRSLELTIGCVIRMRHAVRVVACDAGTVRAVAGKHEPTRVVVRVHRAVRGAVTFRASRIHRVARETADVRVAMPVLHDVVRSVRVRLRQSPTDRGVARAAAPRRAIDTDVLGRKRFRVHAARSVTRFAADVALDRTRAILRDPGPDRYLRCRGTRHTRRDGRPETASPNAPFARRARDASRAPGHRRTSTGDAHRKRTQRRTMFRHRAEAADRCFALRPRCASKTRAASSASRRCRWR